MACKTLTYPLIQSFPVNKISLLCIAYLTLGLLAQAQTGDLTEQPKETATEANAVAAKAEATVNSLLRDSKDKETKIEIPVTRNDMTITESYQIGELTAENIGANYDLDKISNTLSEALENDAASHSASGQADARIHLRNVLIGFILEIILTIIVLQIAFSLSGFPFLFYQIALLGLAVALAGAALEYFLLIGLFNPIRIGLSFIILLILIRQLTDVREWATAIRIAILARIISLGLMWVAFAGVMVAFGL